MSNQDTLKDVPASASLKGRLEQILFTRTPSGEPVPYDIEREIDKAIAESQKPK